jgi:hypothetical protein
MTGMQEMVLLSEIVLQSKIARRAAERLNANHNSQDHVEVWCSIQSILGAAANVSKILWPNKKYAERGEKLRQLLKVEKDNLLWDRKFRNHFEHYDERVEEWFERQPTGVYIDLSMNPSLRTSLPNNDHRGYNAFNNTLLFRGELLDLDEVLKALEEIYEKCKPYVLT